MGNESGYVARFRKCEKPKVYLRDMYESAKDKLNFWILEMRTSETKIFRHEYINALAREILRADDFIYIISGELSSNIWNSSEIINAISSTKAKNIKILCGPQIDIKSIGVLKLAAIGKIELFFSKKRYKKHFLLTEKKLFVESGHKTFDFSDEILMTSKDASEIIFPYKEKFEKRLIQKKPSKYALANRILKKLSPRVIKLGGKEIGHTLVEEILQNFSPRIFETNAKENNRDPTEKEIEKFKKQLEVQLNPLAN
ncbi:MAG: hypothetical protein WA063_01665 [Minisyncoccia bacterium]